MELKASNRSAFFAGIWSALTLVPFEAWMDQHRSNSVLSNNLLWFIGMAAFFFVPAYFFVIGRENGPFSRSWFMDPEQRARYAVIMKRGLIWFLGACVTGVMWSLAFSFLWRKP